MNRIRAKHREDLLLAILNDVETGVLKGERFTAYDVSRMGAPRAIQIDDDGGGSEHAFDLQRECGPAGRAADAGQRQFYRLPLVWGDDPAA